LSDAAVNENVSTIASIAQVREYLVSKQRGYAPEHDLVMEGRDIGTVVFPDTKWKFYVDASPEVRAARRARQGYRDEIVARDRRDSSRAASPLMVAKDACLIDSSHLDIEGVVGAILEKLGDAAQSATRSSRQAE
jgi:cytidylate kinase